MKKSLMVGALIAVIAVTTFIAQRQSMKLADARANEIYSAAVASAVKTTPRTTVQRITNTPKEKEFLSGYVKQEFKDDTFTEKTISGTLIVAHEHQLDKKGNFIAKEAKDIHELYLSTPTETYKVENISYPVLESLNEVEVSLTGLLSSKKNYRGEKTLVVNIPGEKIKTLKIKSRDTVKDWKSVKVRDTGECSGNYCALIIPLNFKTSAPKPPSGTEIEKYIFGAISQTGPFTALSTNNNENGRIKRILNEISYGQMDYDGVVTDWINLPDGATVGQAFGAASSYITNNGIDLNNFDQLVYLFYAPGDPIEFIGGAMSNTYYHNGTYYNIGRSQVGMGNWSTRNNLVKSNGNLSAFDYTYIHETGHNLEAPHDNSSLCKNGPSSLPSECVYFEYGNQYSVMGTGSRGGDFSFWNKLKIGWIEESDITISQNGIFNLNPLETPGASFVGVNINPADAPLYVFEYRRPVGLDNPLLTPVNIDGLFVYTVPRHNELPINSILDTVYTVVDVSPSGTFNQSFSSYNDMTLRDANSFSDISHDLQFLGNSVNNQGELSIGNLGLGSFCVSASPKIFRDSGDFYQQIPVQSWTYPDFGGGLSTPSLVGMPVFHVDVSDPTASFDTSLIYKLFNDQTMACLPETYHSKLLLNGQLLTEQYSELVSWSFDWSSLQASVPVYGLSYGQHHLTLEISQASDGSMVSYDLVFELAPL